MKRLYILEQKIKTLEIILETLVEELMDEGLIDEDRFDNNIIAKIKKLSEELEIEKEEQDEKEITSFPFFGKKGEA
tara:strand:- start:483 stop:710 length:228 start_codon:yes stop_codon:yes gene_type:complete